MNKSEKCARWKMSELKDVSDSSNMTNPLGMEYSTEKVS
jgi:hypothetical protein